MDRHGPGRDGGRDALTRLAILGAGHAHLHLLHQAASLRQVGLDPVLVSPAAFHYSGLATGVLSGALPPEATTLDVAALAAAYAVPHVEGEAVGIDLAERRLEVQGGRAVAFDLLSLNVGSVAADPAGLLGQPGVWAAKPLASLFDLRLRLEERWRADRRVVELVVAGGRASAHEIAAALLGLARRLGGTLRLTVVGPASGEWLPRGALRALRTNLAARGARFRDDRVVGRAEGICHLASGGTLPCGMLVLAGGLRAAPLVAQLGLPVDRDGRLRVTAELRPAEAPFVFATGDCAVVDGAERPPLGVFGVRAAPFLAHNLRSAALQRPARSFRPQRSWLSILDLGDETGLAVRGRLWWQGRSSLRLKRHLDLDFLERVRRHDRAG